MNEIIFDLAYQQVGRRQTHFQLDMLVADKLAYRVNRFADAINYYTRIRQGVSERTAL